MTKIIITGSFIGIIHYSDKRILKSIYSSGTKRRKVETNVSRMCHLPPLSIQVKNRTTEGANGESHSPHQQHTTTCTGAHCCQWTDQLWGIIQYWYNNNRVATINVTSINVSIISNHSDYFSCPSRILPIHNIWNRKKTLQKLFCQVIKQTSHLQTVPFKSVRGAATLDVHRWPVASRRACRCLTELCTDPVIIINVVRF